MYMYDLTHCKVCGKIMCSTVHSIHWRFNLKFGMTQLYKIYYLFNRCFHWCNWYNTVYSERLTSMYHHRTLASNQALHLCTNLNMKNWRGTTAYMIQKTRMKKNYSGRNQKLYNEMIWAKQWRKITKCGNDNKCFSEYKALSSVELHMRT